MGYNLEIAVARGNPRAIARANGAKMYMPDTDCPKGHRSLRYTKYGQCLDCLKISKVEYRNSEKGKAKEKEYAKNYEWKGKQNFRLRQYGITQDEYDLFLFKQNNKCAICEELLDNGKRTYIDHCHNSSKVRGILCWSCNVGIGHFKDNKKFLLNAIRYLED